MPAPFNHSSGLPDAYDRSPDNPAWSRLVFREKAVAQGAEFNEMQSIMDRRNVRVGNMVAKDGDRVTGADIIVDPNTGTVVLGAGTIYVRGDVRQVSGMTMNGVPMTGNVTIGVRLTTALITEVEDPTLLGLAPGTVAEGEPGAAREVETIAWGREGDGQTGDLYSVYLLKDGVVVDQTPPPQLSGVTSAIASYDRDAHGNYIVEGCKVSALGKTGTEQVFSISEGVANIWGYKRSRDAALIHKEVETWDVEAVAAEVHSFDDGGSGTAVISVNHYPIATLNTVIITKETTQTITKGTTNSADALPHSSVTSVIEVKQGGTTYDTPGSYSLVNDTIDWSAGGAEPSSGSSYTVKYRYLVAVTPVTQDDKTVTVTGGVTGTTVLVGYDWKLPRIDLLCLDGEGLPVYVKGASMRVSPQPPMPPMMLLPLATIDNNYMGKPTVKNIGVRAYHFTKIDRMYNRMVDMLDLLGLERLKNEIDRREPVAKKGVFVDPLIDDTYRDLGVAQNAAVFQGSIQLPIAATIRTPSLSAPALLDYTSEVVIDQSLVTDQIKINPYNSYERLPCEMHLEPPVDFWVDQPDNVTSESFITKQVVQEIHVTVEGKKDGVTVTETRREQINTEEDIVGDHVALVPYMRQIAVNYTIKGFGAGEELDELEFGGFNVKPATTVVADGNGQISGSFTIPANVPTGRVMLYASGMGGSYAQALFVSNGYYDIETVHRVTTKTVYITRTITTTKAPRPNWVSDPLLHFLMFGVRDPVAQTFMLPEDAFVTSISVKMAALGDKTRGLLVEVVKTEHGFPTGESLTQARVDLSDVEEGDWVKATFTTPVYLVGGVEYAFVVLTDDNDHALATASIGGFDPIKQQFVGAQPYSVGMLLSSANAQTWTAHQKEDLAFKIEAAKFNPTTKTISFGTFSLTSISDIMVRAATLLPSADTTVQFEIERASGEKKLLNPNVNWEMDEFLTETVTLRAILKGTAKLSPVLYPYPLLVLGRLATSATYVSRAMNMGTAVRLSAFLKLLLPTGADLTVQFDKSDGVWLTADIQETTVLDEGWIEREYRYDSITALSGRLKITLTGSPAARPSIQDLRAVSI
jgi:hypothetical protein